MEKKSRNRKRSFTFDAPRNTLLFSFAILFCLFVCVYVCVPPIVREWEQELSDGKTKQWRKGREEFGGI